MSIESFKDRKSLWTIYKSDEVDEIQYLRLMGSCYYGKY